MNIFRSSVVVSSLTFISRIFGLIRELFIADLFGAGSNADAVNIAFKLPNLFRRIFGEGALSTVFVPIFTRKLLESHQLACNFTGKVFTLLLGTLLSLTLTMQILMPYLMFIIAPGFQDDIEKFDLTVLLCRIMLPYLIFISIAALFGGILNSVGKFFAFAISPVILSAVTVIGTSSFSLYYDNTIAISISVLLAGILQVFFMWIGIKRANLTFNISFNFKDREVIQFLKNMGPATISAGVGQLNLFISQSIASFIAGAVSILSYADRIYQFPLSIIGTTFSTILLPELSRIYKSDNIALANEVQNKAIKIALLLSFPASCGIISLAHPIIHIIYERGAFTALDTTKTADTIAAFTFGLPAFILAKILLPIFYANNDTKTPLKITIYSLITNTVLNILFMQFFAHVGIAIGTSGAAWINIVILYYYAKKMNKIMLDPSLKIFIVKTLLACFVMSMAILSIKHRFNIMFYSDSLVIKASALLATIIFSSVLFLLIIIILRLHKVVFSRLN